MLVFSLYIISNWYFASDRSLEYKHILSISGLWITRLSNAFVFPDPEPPTINTVYGWSEIYDQFVLSFVFFCFYYH